jgi:hypothetical protein
MASAAAEDTISLTPCFLIRVAGLPFTALDELQFPQTVAIMEEILTIEAWLNQQQERLLEELRQYSEQFTENTLVHKCLDLRRAIASQNGKKAHKLLQAIAAQLPETLAATVETWCNYAIRRAELLAAGEPTLQTELTRCRAALRRLLSDDDFQCGLLLSSPTLYTELQHYRSTPPDRINNRLRRAEEGLLSYLVRMAAKTSPYSTFTSTALGFWQDPDDQPARLNIRDWQKKSVIRFHAGIISGIIRALSQRPEVRPYLRPALNTTIQRKGEKIEFFVCDKILPLLSGRYRERLIRLRLNSLTRAIVDAVESSGGTLMYGELIEKVSASERAPAREVTQAIEFLADRGALYITLPVPDHENDKLGCIVRQLATIPGEWVATVRAGYAHIYALAEACATVSAPERHRILIEIQQRTRELSYQIGHLKNEPATAINEEIEKCFRDLILEDTVLVPQQLTLNRAAWQPLLNDLAILQQLTPLLDEGSAHRLIASCFIEAAFRAMPDMPANDIIDYYMHLSLLRERSRLIGASNTFDPSLQAIYPQLAQLMELRHRFIDLVQKQITWARARGDRRLALNPAEIQRFTALFPDHWKKHYTFAYFGQLFHEDGRNEMVINLCWPGPGTAFSRFSHLLQPPKDLTDTTFTATLRDYIAKLGQQRSGIYASIAETASINVNIREPLTPFEILYPNSISTRPREELLPLRDIQVYYDPRTRQMQLFSQRLGMPVYPLHTGYALLDHMPPLYQTLISMNQHYVEFDLIARIEAKLSPAEKAHVRYYPRISMGHVTLNRETWKIPQALLPQREADDTAFTYFLKVNRWRAALGLPVEGFSRVSSRFDRTILRLESQLEGLLRRKLIEATSAGAPTTITGDAVPAQATVVPAQPDTRITAGVAASSGEGNFTFLTRITENDTIRKPLYVNFHNYLLLTLFERAVKAVADGESLTFQEMLPARNQHLLHRDRASYVTEFVIELSS